MPIELPPLRARPSEIEPLARHLLARVGSIAGRSLALGADAIEVMVRHAWPGNVRQLENAIEHAVAVCRGQTIHAEDLPIDVREPGRTTRPVHGSPATHAAPASPPAPAGPVAAPHPGAEDDEASRLRAALEAHRWNRGAAAEALGMSRTTLWRKLRALGLV
ncbi:MAG: hypothetical protein IT385_14725 [Deltaproteobacteria bacterium]|nr:hypothetical protein [Deltaproteobacteria bacterium]